MYKVKTNESVVQHKMGDIGKCTCDNFAQQHLFILHSFNLSSQ